MVKKHCIVAVCGGFDPIHVGHIRHFKEAKKLGDKLVVMLNSDDWLLKKKGFVFMKFDERKEIIESIKYVDKVVPYEELENGSVSKTLQMYKPNIFAKGGDRTIDNIPKDEVEICKCLGIKLVVGVGGGKVQSSSWLVDKAVEKKTTSLKKPSAANKQ
jgi:glycerol-3-phosphate cytidylyltransferase